MKRFLCCFLLFASVNLIAQKQKSANDLNEIMDLLNKQAEQWNKGNIEGFMNGYWENDSLMFIGKSGVTYGYKNTLNNYKKGYGDTAHMGKLFFTPIQFRKISQDYYFVVGKWFLKRSVGDIGGHYTLLIRKIKGKWVIVADHSS